VKNSFPHLPRSSAPATRDPRGGGKRTDGITPHVRTGGPSPLARGDAHKKL